MKSDERQPARPSNGRYRRYLPHLQVRGKTYFVTFSTRRQWTLPESIRSRVLECCVSHHSITFYLHAAVVMPDHVHLLLTPLQDDDGAAYGLPEILQGIKGASAHAVNHALSGTGAVWEQESFDRLLQSDERVAQKAEYICENPVRAGLVAQADEWPWIWRAWVEGRAPDTISR